MCNCSNQKNQTSKEIFEFIADKKNEETLGIGLFLIPAPEKGILEFKSIAVENITLKETAKRGINCESFKFFPYEFKFDKEGETIVINSIEDIDKLVCRDCVGNGCNGYCFCSHWMSNCVRW